ncbi:MAG TPA: hypothetical protein VHO24_18555 [Opitutaceae bacterium]|nr:hypothetical protein [Opitutaceae bacterium]
MPTLPSEKSKTADRTGVPTEPTRVKTFAKFFKNYMSISAVVAAALPIPVTSLKLIPTYTAHTSLLSTYTSLFCFLLLGFIFYSRHSLARWMFPGVFGKTSVEAAGRRSRLRPRFFTVPFFIGLLPAQLISLSLCCVFLYHAVLDASFVKLIADSGETAAKSLFPNATDALEGAQSWQIANGTTLMVLYLGIFVFAEAAFIMMALKEYLQDLIKLSELDLIAGPGKVSSDSTAPVEILDEPAVRVERVG